MRQPLVNQQDAAKAVNIAGVDIYHPTQNRFDGATIGFGGAIGRSLKKDNYLVLETQSQGRLDWLAYPGQLRQAYYSHLASGANGVMYWNWHSIHNSLESYWKGIISLIHTFPGTRIMLSSEEGNYTDSTDPWFTDMVSKNLGLDLIYVEDFQKLTLHVSKIGVYCTDRNPREAALLGKQYYEGKANIVVSGDFWMDYVPLGADKGKALTELMRHLGISREETVAFGDNINDIGLLKAAGDSYA